MAINDPQKRSSFLDEHPGLALSFGISKDPSDYVTRQPVLAALHRGARRVQGDAPEHLRSRC
jgi:hypothetical protein